MRKKMLVAVDYIGKVFEGDVIVDINEDGIWWSDELELWSSDSWYIRNEDILDYDISLDGTFVINFIDGSKAIGTAQFVDIGE